MIKLFIMDIDGTLSDGHIYFGPDGEVMKSFDVKDGYGIKMLQKNGVIPVIITGRDSRIVSARAADLGITELHQNTADKLSVLRAIGEKYSAGPEEIAYIGDDLNDMECMGYCAYSAAPADATPSVRELARFKCLHNGGRGAVREFCEYVLSVNETFR